LRHEVAIFLHKVLGVDINFFHTKMLNVTPTLFISAFLNPSFLFYSILYWTVLQKSTRRWRCS